MFGVFETRGGRTGDDAPSLKRNASCLMEAHMFMRITWGRIREGMWEEYERRFEQLAAEQLKIGGPKRRFLVRDIDDPDAGFAISIFDTQEDMRSWSNNQQARERTKEEMADLYIGEYRSRQCEVRLQLG